MTTVFNRLGPYDIVQPLGSGGMAQVFLATDTRSAERVALRLVPLGFDHEAKEILEAERLGAQLQEQFSAMCPLVPKVFEHGELPDYFYVAMECLDGGWTDAVERRCGTAGRDQAFEASRVWRREGRHAAEHLVEDHADGPEIGVRVHLPRFQAFR